MVIALQFVYDILGGWRGVALASLLLLSLGWGGCNHFARKHLKGEVDRLSAEQSVNRGLIAHQNQEVEKWKAAADGQTKLAQDAQKAQLALAATYPDRLKRILERMKFTGVCETDVEIAAREFERAGK